MEQQDSRHRDIEFYLHQLDLRPLRRQFPTRCNRIITVGILLTADVVDTKWPLIPLL